MKRLLNITMLITALLFVSCKEDSGVDIIGKSTKKNVKILSYFFNSQNEDSAVKSGNNTDSTNKIGSKVLSIETWEVGGEFFTASLIEENDPIATKADITYQQVDGSSVYTFYAYKDSEIKPQSITGVNKTIEVPVDENTNYGMLFLSSADGMNNPKEVTIPPTAINKTNKEITYNAKLNENLCYTTFNRETMPATNPIDVIFKPVFAQLGVFVPRELVGSIIYVNSIKLMSGAQQTAIVKIKYNSNPNPNPISNISVTYDKVSTKNYQVDLSYKLNETNDTTILQGRYYNIIPNGNNAKIYIKMSSSGGGTLERTIDLKDKDSQPIKFAEGKRYKLLINNRILDRIEVTPETTTLVYGLTVPLTAEAVYSDGTREDITASAKWSSTNTAAVDSKGLVTVKKEGTATITATYQGKSDIATVTPQIWKRLEGYYYQWDAYEPFNPKNYSGGGWGSGRSGYNPNGYPAKTQKFKKVATYDDIQYYLGDDADGVFNDANYLIYSCPNGNLYCSFLWFKRKKYCSGRKSTSAKIKKGRPKNTSQYFCLPTKAGHYCSALKGFYGGSRTFYWLSGVNGKYEFEIFDNYIKMPEYPLDEGYIPLIESDFYVN